MSNTVRRGQLNTIVNDATLEFLKEVAKELDIPLSAVAAFVLQTHAREACKDKGQLLDFYKRRYDAWKERVLRKKPIPPKENSGNNDALLQAISEMLKPIREENSALRSELTKLKADLGA